MDSLLDEVADDIIKQADAFELLGKIIEAKNNEESIKTAQSSDTFLPRNDIENEDLITCFSSLEVLMKIASPLDHINNSNDPILDMNISSTLTADNEDVNSEIIKKSYFSKINEITTSFEGVTDEEYDPHILHRAVFLHSLTNIDLLLSLRNISFYDIADQHGNTPLLLAIKLRYIDVAIILINCGSNCDVISQDNFHLLDEAVLTGDRPLISLVYSKMQSKLWTKWTVGKPYMLKVLKKIPDFYIEMNWKFECNNLLSPIIQLLAPFDNYCIWKRGNWIRIDSTLIGFESNFIAKRGNLSLIFMGSGNNPPGDLILIDRVKHIVTRPFDKLENPKQEDSEKAAKELLRLAKNKNAVHSYNININNLIFQPVSNGSSQFNHQEVAEEFLEEWPLQPCSVWVAEADVNLISLSKKRSQHSSLGTYEDYFSFPPLPPPATSVESVAAVDVAANAVGVSEAGASVGTVVETENEHTDATTTPTSLTTTSSTTTVPVSRGVSSKCFEKKVTATVWMQRNIGFQLSDLQPALDVLALKDKYMIKLKEVFENLKRDVPQGYFPVKLRIPLFLGVSAVVTFGSVRVEEPIEDSDECDEEGEQSSGNTQCAIFEIPVDYICSDD